MRLTALLLCLVSVCSTQEAPFQALGQLAGKWTGDASGKPGKGKSEREYSFELRGRYLMARNRTEYPIQEGKPKAEIHEDIGIFSYDKAAAKVILRQFHVEGFVNEYQLANYDASSNTFEFVTSRIENIPAGWRAKEVYVFPKPGELNETFYLAAPGKDFEVYSQARLTRTSKP